ncbi:MAG TPA: tetratricopeptide repeat protein [Balneolales bacterium]|nr:tetratricopeptide repeat protein [Balneolales bacterium]
MYRHRNIFPFLVALPLLVSVGGCHGVLKSSWNNFTAYYNTFYNAKHQYEDGLKQIEKQKVPINAEEPIPVFTKPLNVGSDNFDQAISKSADILRDHVTSKWADNALLLIGQSYFYESKFFSASQKFDELTNTTKSATMQQRAAFWKGRTYIEMKSYDEGIDYLQRKLGDTDIRWNKHLRAEAIMALAELQVGAEEYGSAISSIKKALPELKDRLVKARSWFLLGQLQEKAGDFADAFKSYSRVNDTHPEYELVSAAMKKQAIVARKGGHPGQALAIFTAMSKDDKNYDILPELEYQIGRTLEAMNRFGEALDVYEQNLHNNVKPPDANTKAQIYYGLGMVYRDHYHNFTTAAAYFDSASSTARDLAKLPTTFNATELAKSFGDYAKLRRQIHNLDSLYWLGSLPKQKFDSVIAVVKKQKLEQLKQEIKSKNSQRNTLVNVNEIKNREQQQGDYGFLNYENPSLVLQSSQAFRAIWGDRPLVDNWRRMAAVRSEQVRAGADTTTVVSNAMSDQELQRNIQVDLSNVPLTPDARAKARRQIAEHQYELGNVFYLSLNMPDSAISYYIKIIHKYADTNVSPQAMYSLTQLYNDRGDSTRAKAWADSVVSLYPRSAYAMQLQSSNLVSDTTAVQTGEDILVASDTLRQFYYQLLDSTKQMPPVKAAERLRSFGLNYSVSNYAPDALYNAAQYYIIAAKEDTSYKQLADKWNQMHEEWQQEEEQFQNLKDTAKVKLQASGKLSNEEQKKWKQISDSTLTPPPFHEYYPYQGAYWDSARTILSQITSYFPTYNKRDDIQVLKAAIQEMPKGKAKK